MIYKTLIDYNLSHDEFVSINNVLKEKIKSSNNKSKFKLYKAMLSYHLKCRKNTASKNPKYYYGHMTSLWIEWQEA